MTTGDEQHPSTTRERAIAELPIAHAVALRLRDAGAGEQLTATALAIPRESVRTLLDVADAKLAAIYRERGPWAAARPAAPTDRRQHPGSGPAPRAP